MKGEELRVGSALTCDLAIPKNFDLKLKNE